MFIIIHQSPLGVHRTAKIRSKNQEESDKILGKTPRNFLHEFTMAESKHSLSEKDVLNRSKEGEPHHHHETHGRSDDIDKSTPVDEVKGPNVFERVKEEVEAIVGAILPKKDHDNNKN